MFEEVYSHVIHQAEDHQIRLTVSTFREQEYLQIRKYFLDFDEEWHPTKEGVSMPLDLENSRELFRALVETLSLAESKDIIVEHFSELIKAIY